MTGYLLDTSTISAAMWKVPAPEVVRQLREHGADCAMAALTWDELRYGVRRLPAGKRRQVLERFLDEVVFPTIPVLAYDERAAAWHADERARLERLGKTPAFVDAQLAAIAVTNGLSVVTANVADFRPFKGLRVLNWLGA